MDNFNIDKNTMDKLNSMLNNGNLNDMLSQIPPDAIKNLSNMMNANMNQKENASTNASASIDASVSSNHSDSSNTANNVNSANSANNFDFSNIDINTIMKMKTIMDKMNNSSDSRSNLLQSLKPYLRDEKKSKLDQYSKLLTMTNLMELFNQNNSNNKENSSD